MKSELDKEIDRWLRGHTEATRRRDGGSASTSDAGGNAGNGHDAATVDTAAHLDADELSAYAENALPAQTRLRYASHLADCDHCRKIATGIALASGVAAEIEKREAATSVRAAHVPKSSWSEWLAALFSPRSLRYVAPVLAVMLVGIVAFVALRQNAGEQSLARRDENSARAPNTQTADDTTVSETTGTTGDTNTATTGTNADAAAPPPPAGVLLNQPQPKSEDAPAPTEIAKSASAPTVADKTAANVVNEADSKAPLAMKAGPPEKKVDEDANFAVQTTTTAPAQSVEKERTVELEESARVYAGAANAQAPPPQQNRANNYGVGRKRAGGSGDDQMAQNNRGYEVQQQRGEQQRDQRELARDDERMKDDQRAGARARSSAPKSAPAEPSRSTRRDESPPRDARESVTVTAEAKTRSVGGRRFRSENGTWTDTAYRAGQATTNISRGSKSFRDLAAADPTFARIARELGGTVIVVWKNRIYRIQ